MLKIYMKSYIYLFSIILILTIIYTIINYYLITLPNIIKVLIAIISIFISSIILGKNTREKAYLEGIKFTSIYLIISIIISILFKNTLSLKSILYYFLVLLSGVIGSMIGININKKQN